MFPPAHNVHNSGWRIKEVKEVKGTTVVRGLSILVCHYHPRNIRR